MNWEKVLFRSGDLFLPTSVRGFLETYWIGNDTSIFYISWWTFIHFISGILTGWILSDFTYYYIYGFLIHTIWELWQIIGKNTKYWTTRGQVDVLVDTISYMLGMTTYRAFLT
jgi:hypothetical protein